MKAVIEHRIVNIAIPLKGGTHCYFSGFFIAANMIVTCRHGFDSEKDYDNTKDISVSSQLFDEKIEFTARNMQGLIDQGLLLFESEKYDIAILKCISQAFTYQRLYLAELEEKGQWESGGYPFFNRHDEETGGYRNFSGTFESPATTSTKINLTVEPELPEMKDWREVSGSPVFIQGKLAGVVKGYSNYQCTDKEKDKRDIPNELKAIYLKRLWDDSNEVKFRQILEQIIPKNSAFREKIQRLLQHYPTLKAALVEQLNVGDESVLDTLCQQSKHDIMGTCSNLQNNKQLEGVDDLLLYAIAAQYENDGCFNQQANHDTPYINVPIATLQACEFLMAAEDKREPCFVKDKNHNVMPKKYSIIPPPESGIHSTIDEDMMTGLLSGRGDYKVLVERLFEDYKEEYKLQPWITYDAKRKKDLVGFMLEDEAATYYWLLQNPESHTENLRKIVKSLPQVKILKGMGAESPRTEHEEQVLFLNLGKFVKES